MIGTHNSLTSYKPRFWIMNLFKWLWRCQNMSFEDQLKTVDYFDIRVRFDKKGFLHFCHGLVDLDVPYSLNYILSTFKENNKKCRIVLERGEADEDSFLCLISSIYPDYKEVVDIIVIKRGWQILYGNAIPCKDCTYIPFYSDKSFWENLKHLKISTIKKWAKKHNPNNVNTLESKNLIYFVDYFNI